MSISALGAGLSGMQGFQNALTISANNVANSLTTGFQPAQASFRTGATGGVSVTASAGATTSAPNAASGTNLTDEMVNQVIDKNSFAASADVVKASDQMLGTLVDIKA